MVDIVDPSGPWVLSPLPFIPIRCIGHCLWKQTLSFCDFLHSLSRVAVHLDVAVAIIARTKLSHGLFSPMRLGRL